MQVSLWPSSYYVHSIAIIASYERSMSRVSGFRVQTSGFLTCPDIGTYVLKSVYPGIIPDIGTFFYGTRYRVLPGVGYFTISGHTRYRVFPDIGYAGTMPQYPIIPDIGYFPILGMLVKYPISVHKMRSVVLARYRV